MKPDARVDSQGGHIFSVWFSPCLAFFMLNYCIPEKRHHQNVKNGQSLTFLYIIMHEIYGGGGGMGLNLALQKDN